MGITETLIIYLLIGATVAGAIWLSDTASSGPQALVHLVLWPLFAPTLFDSHAGGDDARAAAESTWTEPRLEQVEVGILDALRALDGTPQDVLRPEIDRVRELVDSLDAMARRRDAMGDMLSEPAFDRGRATRELDALERTGDADSVRLEALESRLEHIERLEQMHTVLSRDIERTLLELEEMTSQIRLLRFADSPVEEVSDLVRDITATVEGLTEGLMAEKP